MLAKGLHAFVVGLPGALLRPLLIYLLVGLPLELVVLGLVLALAGGFLAVAWGLLVDLYRPYLDWEDPQRAMKGNLNPLLTLLAAGFSYGLPAVILLQVSGRLMPPVWTLVLLGGWTVGLATALLHTAMREAPERYLDMG